MECWKRGRQSFLLPQRPRINAWASVAGKLEAQGPLGDLFDYTAQDTYFGQKTWEQAEQQMQMLALRILTTKARLRRQDLDVVLSGDLLNQCIGSTFGLANQGIPHLGLYGACSTMAESLLLASVLVGSGAVNRAAAMTSSHFASSERQYRFPLAYGGQRPPTAQRTVTGAGAVLLTMEGSGPQIFGGTIGTVQDLGIRDSAHMGAAMAPAAYDTIRAHLEDLQLGPEAYDLIVTGDLGRAGTELLLELARLDGLCLGGRVCDCGMMIYDSKHQDVHSGGSGCGCSAVTLCSDLLGRLKSGKLRRILFCGTGALLSPVSSQQGLPIPAVCHAVSIGTEE